MPAAPTTVYYCEDRRSDRARRYWRRIDSSRLKGAEVTHHVVEERPRSSIRSPVGYLGTLGLAQTIRTQRGLVEMPSLMSGP